MILLKNFIFLIEAPFKSAIKIEENQMGLNFLRELKLTLRIRDSHTTKTFPYEHKITFFYAWVIKGSTDPLLEILTQAELSHMNRKLLSFTPEL